MKGAPHLFSSSYFYLHRYACLLLFLLTSISSEPVAAALRRRKLWHRLIARTKLLIYTSIHTTQHVRNRTLTCPPPAPFHLTTNLSEAVAAALRRRKLRHQVLPRKKLLTYTYPHANQHVRNRTLTCASPPPCLITNASSLSRRLSEAHGTLALT